MSHTPKFQVLAGSVVLRTFDNPYEAEGYAEAIERSAGKTQAERDANPYYEGPYTVVDCCPTRNELGNTRGTYRGPFSFDYAQALKADLERSGIFSSLAIVSQEGGHNVVEVLDWGRPSEDPHTLAGEAGGEF